MKSASNLEEDNLELEYLGIFSRWEPPLEAFVPSPKKVEPIGVFSNNDDITKTDLEIQDNKAIIAHKTDLSKANSIIESGYEPSKGGLSSLRERAVFGWIHMRDIKYFDQNKDDNCVLLFKANKENIYVSSYESSAFLLGLGKIDPERYEKYHIMKYEKYVSILKQKCEFHRHLDYSPDDLLNNIV